MGQLRFGGKVEQIKVGDKSVSSLLQEMSRTGFQGRKLGEVTDVWLDMLKDQKLTIFLGYAGSLSTTGQCNIIKWLIENRFIDVLVSTGANISEDIVDAMGYPYWQGSHVVNDVEVLDSDYNRYYDVYGKETEYTKMMELLAEAMMKLKEGYPYTTREFLYEIGKYLNNKGVYSIISAAAKHKVPVYCPAITDSPYGDSALMVKSRGFNLVLDAVRDYQEFMGLADKVTDVGVVYIGGGVPKDFIQLLAVSSPYNFDGKKLPNRKEGGKFFRNGLNEYCYPHKYAIQITTDSPQWGGLSGCTFEEAISWGKINPKGRFVQCYSDATIALPLVSHALNERIKKRPKIPDFSWLFENK